MAKKPPKQAQSALRITTSLTPRRVADIATELTSEFNRVHLKGADEGVVHFSISSRLAERLESIAFDLVVAKEGGKTHGIKQLAVLREVGGDHLRQLFGFEHLDTIE